MGGKHALCSVLCSFVQPCVSPLDSVLLSRQVALGSVTGVCTLVRSPFRVDQKGPSARDNVGPDA